MFKYLYNFYRHYYRYWTPFFCIIGLLLATFLLGEIYKLHKFIPPEAQILSDEIIIDHNIIAVNQTKNMSLVVMEDDSKFLFKKKIQKYCSCFDIDEMLTRLIYDITMREGINPELVFKIIWTESKFDPHAIGPMGEIGLMQIKYETAFDIDPETSIEKLHDPAYNIQIGVKYLSDQLNFYEGNVKLALLAYNRGRDNVNRLLMKGENPDNGYVNRVLKDNLIR